MKNNEHYFNYLKQRSLLGYIYRRYFLYPKLSGYLEGELLDIGCGIGDMLIFRPRSTGVDINELNVEYCKRRGLNVYHMMENILPFPNDQFDSILLDNVLEHINEPAPLLSEIKRTIRPNGSILIGVPGIKGFASDSDHKVFYDETELVELAKNAGFRIKKTFHMPLWKSNLLSKIFRQYCIYTLWIAKD